MLRAFRFSVMIALPACSVLAGFLSAHAAESAPKKFSQEQINFFEQKIRPVLVTKCYKCHSAESKELKGGLRVDTREALLVGGDSGSSIVVGKPDESPLIEALRYSPDSYEMPPEGKLPADVIANFERWVSMGLPDPRIGEPTKKSEEKPIDFAKAREFWSLQPPKLHEAPKVKQSDWVRRPIDPFILARQEAAGLEPAPEADRRTLIRRATYDLLGLPPAPEEVKAFLADRSPEAYENLIERLLSSPHYGERWGRHWLDVVRYADDNTNMGPHNGPYPHAGLYRDWVVKALNADVPYDEFIRRQLATDLMDQTGPEDIPALGMMGLSPSYHKEVALAKVVLDNRYADEWEDRVDAIGRGLMGLTLACARCHDHKYDPVTMKDYYALAGVFASSRQTTRPIIPQSEVDKTQPQRDQVAELEKKVAALNKQIKDRAKEIKTLTAQSKDKDETKATEAKEKLEAATKADAEAKKQIAEHTTAIAELKKTPGFVIPVANALTEETTYVEEITADKMKIVYKPHALDLHIYIRGDAGNQGPLVKRRFLEVLSKGEPQPFINGSGRLELAEAIVSRDNPLTARVIVNRVWMQHFGAGLVDTPSNFGKTGSLPSHPELLDDLTVRFMDEGWSLKWLHREIMNSATYRQASRHPHPEKAATEDPDNRLLTYFNRQRLRVEAFRDTVLAFSGGLDKKIGGASGDADDPNFKRRAIYSKVSRHELSDMLHAFDFPDPAIHCAQRSLTTTPLQQLFVLNSPFMRQNANALSQRVLATADKTLEGRVSYLHQLLFGRAPTPQELAIAKSFIGGETSEQPSPESAEPLDFTKQQLRGSVSGLGTDYSVELWVYNTLPNNTRPVTCYFVSRGTHGVAGAAGDHLGISGTYGRGSQGRLLFFNGDRLGQALSGRTELAPKTWNHVVLVREGQRLRVYLNGNAEPEIDAPAKPGFVAPGDGWTLGTRNDGFAPLQGKLEGVAVYDRVLTAEELANHFAAAARKKDASNSAAYAKAVLESKPKAFWPLLDTKTGSVTLADSSGAKQHLSTQGAPVASTTDPTIQRWQRYALALLASNELMYVD